MLKEGMIVGERYEIIEQESAAAVWRMSTKQKIIS